ncbi:MAG: DUF721 domain-containing protein [Nitrospirae bacterium]|nr:DUF721 domain-containing protein [Nitrospirota bacterium]
MKRLAPLISPLLRGLGIEEAVRLEAMKKEWRELFPEPLSLHMFPSVLKDGELLINVDSPVWLQQLTLLKSEISKKLIGLGVKDVRFKRGRTCPEKRPPSEARHSRRISLDADAVRLIEETVSEIKDAPTRESARRAMERSFAGKVR